MITIEDLTVSYGAVQALRNVSFVAETGKITAVLGANGAGKTTLLRTISGLKEPKNGSIRMGDRSLVERISRRAQALPKLVGREGDLVMIGVELAGDAARVVELILLISLETDCVGMDLAVAQLMHTPHDGR